MKKNEWLERQPGSITSVERKVEGKMLPDQEANALYFDIGGQPLLYSPTIYRHITHMARNYSIIQIQFLHPIHIYEFAAVFCPIAFENFARGRTESTDQITAFAYRAWPVWAPASQPVTGPTPFHNQLHGQRRLYNGGSLPRVCKSRCYDGAPPLSDTVPNDWTCEIHRRRYPRALSLDEQRNLLRLYHY